MLALSIPVDIKILNLVENKSYFLNNYSFFAADESIELNTKVNKSIGRMLFSGDGLFVSHASGKGSLVINGLGSIEEIEISSNAGDLILDNGHLLSWDDTISYSAELLNKGSNMFSRVFHSVISSEGVVMRLSGDGKIYVARRNLRTFELFINNIVKKT